MIVLGNSFSENLRGATIHQDEKTRLWKVSTAKCDHPGVPSARLLMKWLSKEREEGCIHCSLISGGAMSRVVAKILPAMEWDETYQQVDLPLPNDLIYDHILRPEIVQYFEDENIDMIYQYHADPFFRPMVCAVLRTQPIFRKNMTIYRYILQILQKRAWQAAASLLHAYSSADRLYQYSQLRKTPVATIHLPFVPGGTRPRDHAISIGIYHTSDHIYVVQWAERAEFLEFPDMEIVPDHQVVSMLDMVESPTQEPWKMKTGDSDRRQIARKVHEEIPFTDIREIMTVIHKYLQRYHALVWAPANKSGDIRDEPWFSITFWRDHWLHLSAFWVLQFSIGKLSRRDFYTSGLFKQIDDRPHHFKKGLHFTSRDFTHISPEDYSNVFKHDVIFRDIDFE